MNQESQKGQRKADLKSETNFSVFGFMPNNECERSTYVGRKGKEKAYLAPAGDLQDMVIYHISEVDPYGAKIDSILILEETSNILLECDASQDVFKSSSVQAYNFPEDVEKATVAEADECFAAHPQEE
ncbi:hypothetical protein V6N13_051956 [Hibiscus sabdariffa]